MWLGDSSSERCTPVLPSIKLRLCWHGVGLGFGPGPGAGPACAWSLLMFDFVITLNLVKLVALTNDTTDRNCADFLVYLIFYLC